MTAMGLLGAVRHGAECGLYKGDMLSEEGAGHLPDGYVYGVRDWHLSKHSSKRVGEKHVKNGVLSGSSRATVFTMNQWCAQLRVAQTWAWPKASTSTSRRIWMMSS